MAIYELEDRIYFDGGLPADIAEVQEVENSDTAENNSDTEDSDNTENVSIAPESPSSEEPGDNADNDSDKSSDDSSDSADSNSQTDGLTDSQPDSIAAVLDAIDDTTLTDNFLDNQNFLIISADNENLNEIANSLNDNTTLITYDSDDTFDSIIQQLKDELGDNKAVNIGIVDSEKIIDNSEKCNDFLIDLKELQYFDGEINLFQFADGSEQNADNQILITNNQILITDSNGEWSTNEDTNSDDLTDYFDSNSAFLSTESLEPNVQSPESINEIYFIDSNIDNIDQILAEIPEDAVVIELADGEGMDKITDIINDYTDIDAVHIISQANYAQILLGKDVITADNIDNYSEAFSSWSDNLSTDADILFYGCDIAKEVLGQSVINQIAEWTGADIAASTDITGGNLQASTVSTVSTVSNLSILSTDIADWDLEYSTGSIEATVLTVASYNHHLLTYTVTEITDDGSGAVNTLSWAINQSNASTEVDDIITFSVDTVTISGDAIDANVLPKITDFVTINGNNVTITVASQIDSAYRVFYIDASGQTVTIENMTINGGDISNYDGGAPTDANYGGGIYIAAGTVNLDSVIVSGSKANSGGGIYNAGNLTVINSVINNNTAENIKDFTGITYAYGGGIYNLSGTVSVEDSTISDNTAETLNSENPRAYGGGIYSGGGTLTVKDSTISNNTVNASNPNQYVDADAYGGGIAVVDTGNLALENSTVAYNTLISYHQSGGQRLTSEGGGVYFVGNSATISNSTIAENIIELPAVAANWWYHGSGVYFDTGTLTVRNSIIAENTYYSGLGGQGIVGDYYGSSTLDDGGYNVVKYQEFDNTYHHWNVDYAFDSGTSILYNYTSEGSPTTGWNNNNGTPVSGSLGLSDTLALNDSTNSTYTLALAASSFAVGAIEKSDGGGNWNSSSGVDDGIFYDQRGIETAAGSISIGAYSAQPPTLYYRAINDGNWSNIATWVTHTEGGPESAATEVPNYDNFIGITIDANVTADIDIYVYNTTVSSGKTLTIAENKTMTVQDMPTTELTVTGEIIENGTLTLNDETIVVYNGGNQTVVAADYSELQLANTTPGVSTTKTFADGITSVAQWIWITDSIVFTGSSASAVTVQVTVPYDWDGTDEGGAANATPSGVFLIWAEGKNVTISNMTIKGGDISSLEEYNFGGGICAAYVSSSVKLENVSIEGSKAYQGGGIFNELSTLEIINSTISYNIATSDGGGILSQGTLTIENSTIAENKTESASGGGIHISGSNTISNSTIAHNTATNGNGCGIFFNSGTLAVRNTIIAENSNNKDYYYNDGTLTDGGYNVVEYQSGRFIGAGKTFTATTDYIWSGDTWIHNGGTITGSLGLSDTLADNGGPTLTLSLGSGSFAAASETTGIPYGADHWNNSPEIEGAYTDQRGVVRTVDQNTSIGAYSANYSDGYYYRSNVSSGSWSVAGSWQQSADGSTGWETAEAAPDETSLGITIRENNTIIVDTVVTADQITVNSNGVLTIAAGGTLTVADDGTEAVDLTADGSIIVNYSTPESYGTLLIASGAAVDSNSTFTINGTLSFNDDEGDDDGTLTLAATSVTIVSLTAGSGTITYDGGNQGVTGTTYYNLTLAGSETKTLSGSTIVENTLSTTTSNFTLGSNTLRIGTSNSGTGSWTNNTSTLTTTGSTVIYGEDGAQDVLNITYNNLSTSGSGTKTLAGAVDINGNLTIGSGTTFDTGTNYQVNLAGNLSNSGTFTANSSAVYLDRGAVQNITDGAVAFSTLDLATGTVLTTSQSITVSGATSGAGTVNASAGTFTYSRSGDQNIFSGTYNAVILSGSGTKSFSGTTTVTGGITVSSNMTVVGDGVSSTIVQAHADPGSAASGVFTIDNSIEVTISDMTIRNGNTNTNGGGINNAGTLTLSNCTISGNTATGKGGGIYNKYDGMAYYGKIASISNCTISGNTAGTDGGGIYNSVSDNTTTTISNSTISGNTANGKGGGIYTDGNSNFTFAVTDCTIANNHSDNDVETGSEKGGGIYLACGTLTVSNTIIANNYTGSGTTGDDYYYSGGTLTDSGYNIVKIQGGASNQFDAATDWLWVSANSRYELGGSSTTDYGLLYLDDTLRANDTLNGTYTLAITSSDSIAVGNGTTTEVFDQRGYYRASNGAVTIGAYEYDGTAPSNNDYISNNTGNWSTASIWNVYNSVTGEWETASTAPDSDNANRIIVASGDTVTVTSDVTIDQTIVTSGGSLLTDISGGNERLTVANGTGTDLIAYGTLTVDFSDTLLINSTASVDANGTFTVNGTLSFDDAGDNNGTLNIASTYTINTLTAGSSTITYDGTGAQTVTALTYYNLSLSGGSDGAVSTKTLASGTTSVENDLTVAQYNTLAADTNTLNLTGTSGTADINGTLSISSGTVTASGASDIDGTLHITAAGSYDANGNFDAANGAITFDGAGNLYLYGTVTSLGSLSNDHGTVTYDGTDQNVADATYYNLSISGSGTKTLLGNLEEANRINTLTVDAVSDTVIFDTDGYDVYATILSIASDGSITDSGSAGRTTLVNISTTSSIGGNITTKSSQTYTGAVTLTGNITLDADDNNILFSNTVDSDAAANNRTLTLDSGTAATTITGAAGSTQALDTLTITNAGTVSLAAVDTRNGGLIFTNAATGTITLNGNISTDDEATAGAVTIKGAVVLGASVQIDTDSDTDAAISFSSTIDGADDNTQSLTLNSGTGSISVTGAIGGTAGKQLATLTVTNSGGASFAAVTTDTGVVLSDTTGTAQFTGVLVTPALSTANKAYNISITGGCTITDNTDFINTGTLTIGNETADISTFTGGLVTTGSSSNPSSVTIAGTVQTENQQIDMGAVTVTALQTATVISGTAALNIGAVTLQDGATLQLQNGGESGGAVSVASVTGTTDGTKSDLTVNTTGTAEIGAIGTDIGTITNSGSGTLTFTGTVSAVNLDINAGSVSASGSSGWTFSGNVSVAGGSTLTAASGGNFYVGGNWTNEGTFTHNNSTVIFNGNAVQSITSGGSSFYNVIVNNTITSGTSIELSDNLAVVNNLIITDGIIDINNYTLAVTGSVMGATGETTVNDFSSDNMIVVNGTGYLQRSVTALSSYLFPVGTVSGGDTPVYEYSPITVQLISGGIGQDAYIRTTAVPEKYSENPSGTCYLNRYWNTTSGGISNINASVTCYYDQNDVVGIEEYIAGSEYISGGWITQSLVDPGTHSFTLTGLTGLAVFSGISSITIDRVDITPSSAQTVTAGNTLQFSAAAYDQYGNLITDTVTDFTWTGTNASGLFTSTTADSYTVTAAYGGISSDNVTVTVTPGNVSDVTISPSESQTIISGDTVQFSAAAYDAYSNLITSTATAFSWTNATAEGLFNTATVGSYSVKAAYSSVSSTSVVVTVNAKPSPNPRPDPPPINDGTQTQTHTSWRTSIDSVDDDNYYFETENDDLLNDTFTRTTAAISSLSNGEYGLTNTGASSGSSGISIGGGLDDMYNGEYAANNGSGNISSRTLNGAGSITEGEYGVTTGTGSSTNGEYGIGNFDFERYYAMEDLDGLIYFERIADYNDRHPLFKTELDLLLEKI